MATPQKPVQLFFNDSRGWNTSVSTMNGRVQITLEMQQTTMSATISPNDARTLAVALAGMAQLAEESSNG